MALEVQMRRSFEHLRLREEFSPEDISSRIQSAVLLPVPRGNFGHTTKRDSMTK